MSNMVGKKSGKDWSEAPPDATHYNTLSGNFFKKLGCVWYWSDRFSKRGWVQFGSTQMALLPKLISKEEDLGMAKKIVKGIDDLEIGMFLSNTINKYCVLGVTGGKVDTIILTSIIHHIYNSDFNAFDSWSLTFEGEYTPVARETKQEKTIRELEETTNKAKQQIKELKEGK